MTLLFNCVCARACIRVQNEGIRADKAVLKVTVLFTFKHNLVFWMGTVYTDCRNQNDEKGLTSIMASHLHPQLCPAPFPKLAFCGSPLSWGLFQCSFCENTQIGFYLFLPHCFHPHVNR